MWGLKQAHKSNCSKHKNSGSNHKQKKKGTHLSHVEEIDVSVVGGKVNKDGPRLQVHKLAVNQVLHQFRRRLGRVDVEVGHKATACIAV